MAGNVLIVGASRGIGLEFVHQHLQQPEFSRVFAACRSPQQTLRLEALNREYPNRLRILPLDLLDDTSIAGAIAAIQDEVPRLHRVINCAGVLHSPTLQPEKRLAQVHRTALERSFGVNAFGPILLAQACEVLLHHDEPSLFASLSARVGSIGDNRLGGWYSYRAAKAAQNMLIRTLALEWQRRRRNTICLLLHPGTTDTDLSAPFQANVPPERLFTPERTVQQLMAILERATLADSGRFLAWDGQEIPW